jgi:hypothetical protein
LADIRDARSIVASCHDDAYIPFSALSFQMIVNMPVMNVLRLAETIPSTAPLTGAFLRVARDYLLLFAAILSFSAAPLIIRTNGFE